MTGDDATGRPMDEIGPVLLAGATGFVGRHLRPALAARGVQVRCASRTPERHRRDEGDCEWVRLDVDDPSTMPAALEGARAAVWLVHEMANGRDYGARERTSAAAFAAAAARTGVERIVYLGGIAPAGTPSRHLESRLATGAVLRGGNVPCFELRASMIIGAGSASWRIVSDLASRLPAMILPRWLASRTQPIAIDDVVVALCWALEAPLALAGVHDVPGPEILSGRDILLRVAGLLGARPWTVSLPVLSPRLSSYWLKLVSGADYEIARELVLGLEHDILAQDEGVWAHLPDHRRLSFDEAARRALADDREEKPWKTLRLEALARRLARRPA